MTDDHSDKKSKGERMRDRVIYAEKYKKGAMKVKKESLPESLPFIMKPGSKIEEIELIESGKLERNDQEFEYAVIKILMRLRLREKHGSKNRETE